jgi:hypothetical protein
MWPCTNKPAFGGFFSYSTTPSLHTGCGPDSLPQLERERRGAAYLLAHINRRPSPPDFNFVLSLYTQFSRQEKNGYILFPSSPPSVELLFPVWEWSASHHLELIRSVIVLPPGLLFSVVFRHAFP